MTKTGLLDLSVDVPEKTQEQIVAECLRDYLGNMNNIFNAVKTAYPSMQLLQEKMGGKEVLDAAIEALLSVDAVTRKDELVAMIETVIALESE